MSELSILAAPKSNFTQRTQRSKRKARKEEDTKIGKALKCFVSSSLRALRLLLCVLCVKLLLGAARMLLKLFIPLIILFSLSLYANIPYTLTNEPIDVVIPTSAVDQETLSYCIEGVKKNCQNIRRIIVVSRQKMTNEAEWYDEADYPFSKYDVALYLKRMDPIGADRFMKSHNSRLGWYYQQLLKLYAPYVIPGISSNVLIVDSDTVFFRPTEFVNVEGGGNYAVSGEYNLPYFEHMARLLPTLRKVYHEYSGICHHMLFQKPILDDLFFQVESLHQQEFWKVFCLCVDPEYLREEGSGASEYEIYFNFAFSTTDQVKIRPLHWTNSGDLNLMQNHIKDGYDFVSYHCYMRN